MGSILELNGTSIIRGGVEILNQASAVFDEGSTTVIVGASGSGKSTLLKVAAGIMPPDKGKVIYREKDLFSLSEDHNREFRKNNGFAFQDGALWSNRSVYDNLSLPLEYHLPGLSRPEIDKRIQQAIRKVGFRDNPQLRPAQLSGGERKMIGFIRALMTDPEIVFLDTPTDNVDAAVAGRIRGIVKGLKKEGKTMLISTHDKELIADVADNLLIIETGEILAYGPLRRVLEGEDEKIREIIGSVIDTESFLGDDLADLMGKSKDNPFEF